MDGCLTLFEEVHRLYTKNYGRGGQEEDLQIARDIADLVTDATGTVAIIDGLKHVCPKHQVSTLVSMVVEVHSDLKEVMRSAQASVSDARGRKQKLHQQVSEYYKKERQLRKCWEGAEAPDPSLFERGNDVLYMCEGQPHYSETELAKQAKKEGVDKKLCLCRKCLAERKLKNFRSQNADEIASIEEELNDFGDFIAGCRRLHGTAKSLLKHYKTKEAWSPTSESCNDDAVLQVLGQGYPGQESPPNDDEEEKEEEEEEEDDEEEDNPEASSLSMRLLSEPREVQLAWHGVTTHFTEADFPMKLVFLDKSGSMACDQITHTALGLAAHNAVHPSRGSSLTMLLAGPGETEVLFRRPGDPPCKLEIKLGCSTWFNEPVVRCLLAVAHFIEKLDFPCWARRHGGEPPVQVLCLTDGADNVSPAGVNTLPGLVDAIKNILGPGSGRPIFHPVTGPQRGLSGEGKIPVWLCFIALGCGGRALLEGKLPLQGLCIIDAVTQPSVRPCAIPGPLSCTAGSENNVEPSGLSRHTQTSKARAKAPPKQRDPSVALEGAVTEAWQPGHRCLVAMPEGRERHGHLVEVSAADGYTVLYADEKVETRVSAGRLRGTARAPKTSFRNDCARATTNGRFGVRKGSPAEQQENVMRLVDLATREPSILMAGTAAGGVTIEDALMRVGAQSGSACKPPGEGSERRDSDEGGQEWICESTDDDEEEGGEDDPAPTCGGEASEEASTLTGGQQEALHDKAGHSGTPGPPEQEAIPSAICLEASFGGVGLAERLAASSCISVKELPLEGPKAAFTYSLMFELGRASVRLAPDARGHAQGLCRIAIEYLLAGGDVDQGQLLAHFEPHLGIAGSAPRSSGREAWLEMLTVPTQALLAHLAATGVLTVTTGLYQLTDGEASKLHLAWRLLDHGHDALRRCVDRFERMRPGLALSSQKRTPPKVPPAKINPLWMLASAVGPTAGSAVPNKPKEIIELSAKDAEKELYAAVSVSDAENIKLDGPTKIKTSDGVEWTVTCQHEWGEYGRDEWYVVARTGDTKVVTFVIMGSLPE